MTDPAGTAYGGFWIRFLAYLVDSVILFCALILLGVAFAFLGPIGAWLMTLTGLVAPLLYWGWMQASARQATFGKALLGMKVTDASGNRMSLLRSLGRELAKWLSAIPLMIGFLIAAFTGRKQALHDIVASTTVVKERPGHLIAALVIGVFGWLAPAALVMLLGAGLLAGMMGIMGGSMLEQMKTEAQKQQPVQSAPVRKPPPVPAPAAAPAATAAAPSPAPAAPPAPAAEKQVAAKAAAPAPAAQIPAQPASKPAAKPAPVPVARPKPPAVSPPVAAVAPPAKPARTTPRKPAADPRKCLEHADPFEVIRCAEAYR